MERLEHLPLTHPRVEPSRGAGLRALAMIGVGWMAMRAFFIIGDDGEVRLRPFPSIAGRTEMAGASARPLPGKARLERRAVGPSGPLPLFGAAFGGQRPLLIRADEQAIGTLARRSLDTVQCDYMGQLGQLFLFGSAAPTNGESQGKGSALAPALWRPPVNAAPQGSARNGGFGLYAYLFWRPDAAGSAADGAPFTSFGGSQWFARADYRFGGDGVAGRSSLFARGSGPIEGEGHAEFALGGAVQPFARVPVTVHAERRLRPDAPNASAAFITGGVTNVHLPHDTRLSAYAQGGAIWPDAGTPTAFFDGQATITAPLHRGEGWRADAGVLAAGGGQKGEGQDDVARLDLGPVVTVSTGAGKGQWEGQIGWRFRVAGDAAPKSGPAVTLSFGF